MTTLISPATDHARWELEVRDPATVANHETVTHRIGGGEASYTLAQISDGWAWKARYYTYASSGSTPWRGPYPARQSALDDVRAMFTRLAAHQTTAGLAAGILARLDQPSLLGGEDPDGAA